MSTYSFLLSYLCLSIVLIGCPQVGPSDFKTSLYLGQKEIKPEILNKGKHIYKYYCHSCHGLNGDGLGPLGLRQKPKVRDLRLGIIKFASVMSGELPQDKDFKRIITRGIYGTSMLPFNIEKSDMHALIQFIKTFSPRWKNNSAGKDVSISKNPWIKQEKKAILLGRSIYKKNCALCHPNKITDSIYGPIKATDLKNDTYRNGDTLEDIYRVIACGAGGTVMPAWKKVLSEKDLWAITYFVHSLKKKY